MKTWQEAARRRPTKAPIARAGNTAKQTAGRTRPAKAHQTAGRTAPVRAARPRRARVRTFLTRS
nr:MAG TPA: hypothetical protein [Caudoviricetes sp.]